MKEYSAEFREEAVRLVIEGKRGQAQVARELGVNNWTLRDWVRKYRVEHLGEPRAAGTETLEEENKRLKRELAILKQERDLLNKAAAYFAKEQQ
jgi:transposase